MNLEEIRTNRVKMILRFSIPSIIAMVLTSMITIIDGFFIGNYVGKEGMAAVNLGLPVIYLYLAIGLMLSVGGVAIAGMLLGAGEHEHSNHVFNQTIVLIAVVMAIASLLIFFCFEPMLAILHAEGQVAVYFRMYYRILLFELPFMVLNSSFGMFIRAEGNPQFVMMNNILNVLLNLILDAFFTVKMHWGVTGIAVASLLSAVITFAWIIMYLLHQSKVFHFQRFQFQWKEIRDSIWNGSSEFIGEMSMSISMFAYNYVIMRSVGSDGVSAFTIVGYVSYLFSMIVIGFGQGASPLISYTYGAKEKRLSRRIGWNTAILVLAAGIFTILIMFVGSGWYSGLFIKNESVKVMAETGIKIVVFSFLGSGINSIASFYFTSIGRAKESAVISSARGLVVLLIMIYLLPKFYGMTGVWLAAPVTEVITLLISLFYFYRDGKIEDGYTKSYSL